MEQSKACFHLSANLVYIRRGTKPHKSDLHRVC